MAHGKRGARNESAAVRIYPRGRWLQADLRKYGGERTVLRNPAAPGWPDRGERTADMDVALEWLAEYMKLLRGARRAKLLGETATRPLADAVKEYLDEREPTVAPSTLTGYRTVLNALCDQFPGAEVSGVDGKVLKRQFLSLLKEGYQPSTLVIRRSLLHAFFDWAKLAPNPAEEIIVPKPVNDDVYVWSDAEVAKLREAADALDAMRGPSGCGARLALELGLCTGAREQELFALQWEDFDQRTQTVRISRQLSRRGEGVRPLKGKKARTAPVMREWWQAFHRPNATGLVLTSPTGRAVVASGARHGLIQSIYDTARLNRPGFGWHALRHRYSLDFLIRTGGAVGLLAKALGHTSIAVTESTYEHLYSERAAEEATARMAATEQLQQTARVKLVK